MLKVEISEDTATELFQDILVQDYLGLINDIKKLKSNIINLKPYQLEDLENNIKYVDAMKVMLTYYLPHDKYTELLNETTDSQ